MYNGHMREKNGHICDVLLQLTVQIERNLLMI
jgi:hypothetical protein